MGRVSVLGSYNLDLAASVPRFPLAGETLAARALLRGHGGKGSNQAVAAARAGAPVRFFGCVGDDDAGRAARLLWQAEGIEDRARTCAGTPTGLALILVDAAGENQIVVVAGANDAVDAADGATAGALAPGDVALAQLEVPPAATLAFFRTARLAGAVTVLNAAPARTDLPAALLDATDVLIANAGEARALCAAAGSAAPQLPGELLLGRVREVVVITAGAEGAFLFAREAPPRRQPTAPAKVVDTTGAGDAFAGAFAAALAAGVPAAEALAAGVAAGTLACTQSGAVAGLPGRDAICAHRRRLPQPSSFLPPLP